MIVEKYTVSMHTKALKAHIPSGLKQVFRQIRHFENTTLFFHFRFVNLRPVRQITAEPQTPDGSFQYHVVIGFRLGRNSNIQRVPFPQVRVPHVSCDSGENIQRSFRVPFKPVNMPPVPVRMQVGGQYCVHIVFIKQRHKGFIYYPNLPESRRSNDLARKEEENS